MPRPRKVATARATAAASPTGDSSPNDSIFSNWSTKECNRLIDYIKTNGFDGDVLKLGKEFPGHTETNIRHFLTELCNRPPAEDLVTTVAAKFEKLQELARVNNLSQSYGSVIPTFVEWRALFENHPDPSTCGGVDYAEIYRTIATLMRGEIPRAINKATAKKFKEVFTRFLEKLKNASPQVQDLRSYKTPVKSIVKTKAQCQATLTNRRQEEWNDWEKMKAKLLLTEDLTTVREIYLTPAWANPFRYPAERSRFRAAKVAARKNALNQEPVEKPAKKKPAVGPKKKRRKKC